MIENAEFFEGPAMTTPETAAGLEGEGLSISRVLGTLSTSGFGRRDALDVNRTLSTHTTCQTSILAVIRRVAHV